MLWRRICGSDDSDGSDGSDDGSGTYDGSLCNGSSHGSCNNSQNKIKLNSWESMTTLWGLTSVQFVSRSTGVGDVRKSVLCVFGVRLPPEMGNTLV